MTDTHSSARTQSNQGKAFEAVTRRKLIKLIITSLLIPISFEVAGIRLTTSLLVMIGVFPFLVQQYFTRVVQWRLPDFLFMLYIFWQALTILLNNPERFVTFTGQQTLLTLTGYLAGRLLILNRQDFMSFVLFWALTSMISVPFAFYESVWDDPIILRLITDYTPFNSFLPNDYEPRMGLFRAQFVFTHPIHYGLMGAMILMLFWHGLSTRLTATWRRLGTLLLFLATFLSISSGAVLSIALQVGTFVAHKIAAKIGPAWRVLLTTGTVLYMILELLSTKSAFSAVSERLAFNSGNAYYRTLIWEYGGAQVMRTPIFGNGYNYWPRPHWMTASVDNHWLAMAMIHGLPALLLLAGSVFYAFFAVNKPALSGDNELDRMRLSWTLTLLGLCMSASTVALWGEIQLFFMLMFGAGFWLADTGPQDQDNAQKPEPTRRHLPYTRFSRDSRTPGTDMSRPRQPSQFSRTKT